MERKPIKVLIVEDDPMVADINRRFTEAVEGFAVAGIAHNGREALAITALYCGNAPRDGCTVKNSKNNRQALSGLAVK